MQGKRPVAWLVAAVMIAAASCDDGDVTPPVPVPGDLVVTLVSPNGAEGAAVLETGDPGIVDIAGAGGVDTYHFERAGGQSRIVVLLDAPGAIGFTLSVEDINDPPELAIVEVADPDNRLRADLTGYEVQTEPVSGALIR